MGLTEPLEQGVAFALVPVVAPVPLCLKGAVVLAPKPAKGRIRHVASLQIYAESVRAIRAQRP